MNLVLKFKEKQMPCKIVDFTNLAYYFWSNVLNLENYRDSQLIPAFDKTSMSVSNTYLPEQSNLE